MKDSAAEMAALCRAMLRYRVTQYYLQQLDPALGTAGFEVDPERRRAILSELRARVTGLAWPTDVQEQRGAEVPIGLVRDEVAWANVVESRPALRLLGMSRNEGCAPRDAAD